MKTLIFILAFTCFTKLNAQSIDRNYIVNWIRQADSTFDVDSVMMYRIDRGLFYTSDSAKLNNRLRQIPFDSLKAIFFSRVKTDNYVPGKGTIYVLTVQLLSTKSAKAWLDKAKTLFVDKYFSFSSHIPVNAKDPVLIIDYRLIHQTEAKKVLDKLKPTEIYDISVGQTPVPVPIYGQNAKNGLVQIWTIKYMKQ